MGDLSFTHVAFLTFQAVVEVIIICFTGFWAAKTGLLNKSAQKNVSALNVDVFTPAMIFSKLAPSLSLKKLFEIFIIPIFYAISTGISYLCSRFVSKYLNLDGDETNFVTAMSVFGNSNSLPVSLTLALSYTLPNLEWDDIEDDDASKIASRGILYLLIFQQIGQVLRWSWGYNTLLKRRSTPSTSGYTDDPEFNGANTLTSSSPATKSVTSKHNNSSSTTLDEDVNDQDDNAVDSPVISSQKSTSSRSSSSRNPLLLRDGSFEDLSYASLADENPNVIRKYYLKVKSFFFRVKSAMNPPLYAMLASVIVASIPPLQNAFYVDNGFIQNTISKAITELGGVSIPLILIVLGSNLYPSAETPPATPHYSRIVIGSLVSRMVLPPLILLPLIALAVRIFPVSILDDPIFVVVAFILTIAPPAIQLSQICQLNDLYEKEMAGVLFWGYVVMTLPTTIAIVAAALWVLNMAEGGNLGSSPTEIAGQFIN